MKKILERYIAKSVILATSLATLIIGGVLFLMLLLKEMKNIGEGDFGFYQILLYVLLRLPNELYRFFPILILLGSIIGLSLLSSSRELSVMRSSGFSTRRIILSVLCAALMMILSISAIGEWIGPTLSYKAEVRKENAKNAGQAVVTAEGVWFHLDNNFVHVKTMIDRQLLEGVTRYQFDDQHRLKEAYYAKTLTLENKQWQMNDVVKTSFYNERVKSQSFAQLPWNLKFNTNLFTVGLVVPNEMSLSKLAKFSRYLKQNGLQASDYQYEFWQRIFQPLASLVMIFLAIPLVLSTLTTATLNWRLVVGSVIGFTFFILNVFIGELCIVYQLPILVAASLPTLLFGMLGVFLSKRMIRN